MILYYGICDDANVVHIVSYPHLLFSNIDAVSHLQARKTVLVDSQFSVDRHGDYVYVVTEAEQKIWTMEI